MKVFRFLFIPLILFLHGCSQENGNVPYGEIVHQGLIEAFPHTLKADGEPKTFEPSSVFEYSGDIYLINDKKPPKGKPSPMVKFSSELLDHDKIKTSSIDWIVSDAIKESRKIEAVTKTLDGKYTLATTAFNKTKKRFQRVLIWPSDSPEEARVLNPTDKGDVVYTKGLTSKFKSALASKDFPEGPDYFKIEGLAALPNDRIIFGFRQIGKDKEHKLFKFILVEVQLKFLSGELKISETIRVIYEFDLNAKGPKGLKSPLGISSIEYSPSRKGIFALTTYELDDEGKEDEKRDLAGYLWFLSLSDLELGKEPTLITKKNGEPLEFDHKSEGLWILDDHRLLIVHDDDRETPAVSSQNPEKRAANQAVFSVVKIF